MYMGPVGTNSITLDRYIAVRNSATVPQMSAVWTASVPSAAASRDAQSAVTSRKWDKMTDGFHEVTQLMISPNLHMLTDSTKLWKSVAVQKGRR